MNCVVCTAGEMVEAKVSTCLHRDSRVALFTSVPTYKCDQCGALEFRDEITECLTTLFENGARPTSYITARHFDLDRLSDQATDDVTSTAVSTFRQSARIHAEPALDVAGSMPLLLTGT
ncbi:MAG: hypothetical protein HYU88_03440 [Chloroflexi bacterium]|nr:hypothetical protein [Chloroflexota bacterium]